MCLNRDELPQRRKRLILVPLHKQGKSPDDKSVYRRICLLDTTSKLLKLIIQSRLTERQDDYGHSDYIFGFQYGRSQVSGQNGQDDVP